MLRFRYICSGFFHLWTGGFHSNPKPFLLHRYSEDDSSNLDEMPLMMSEEGFENEESDYQALPRTRLNRRQRGLGWFLLGGWRVLCGR